MREVARRRPRVQHGNGKIRLLGHECGGDEYEQSSQVLGCAVHGIGGMAQRQRV